MNSKGISFTALFTGHVWYEHGLSNPFFTSTRARLLYHSVHPFDRLAGSLVGLSLQDMLLQRHLIMDHRIDCLVKEQGVSQILEIACGYSPRGYALSRKYPGLKYVEADLPHMAKRKQSLLERHEGFGPDHRVVAIDVFEQDAPHGLEHVIQQVLDPERPTIVITEGLVNYFQLSDIQQVWQRLAQAGSQFPNLWYLTDLVYNFRHGLPAGLVNGMQSVMSVVTRSSANLHYDNDQQIEQGFLDCGFNEVQVHCPEDYAASLAVPIGKSRSIVRVVEAAV